MRKRISGKFSILNDIIDLPYISGSPKNSNNLIGHEINVKDILLKDSYLEINADSLFALIGIKTHKKVKNITEFNAKKIAKMIKNHKLNVSNLKGKFFIYQPCGTQHPPDFVIINDGAMIFLELKSNKKNAKITWNSGRPIDNYIYLFSCPKGNYFFLGQDYPGAPTKSVQFVLKCTKFILNRLNNKYLLGKNNKLNEYIYFRPMYVSDLLDKLNAADINNMKQNVIDYASNF